MQLTKYEHACLVLDKDGQKLIIDPGVMARLPSDLSGVAGIVITHEHQDHFDIAKVKQIAGANPGVQIFSTAAVCASLAGEGVKADAISGTQSVSCGGFSLTLYETDHAPVYRQSPCKNLAVKVDDYLFFPGDSFHVIDDPVSILALPTSGPWTKAEEMIDQANAIKSERIIAAHNGFLSEAGHGLMGNTLTAYLTEKSRTYVYLEPGQSIS